MPKSQLKNKMDRQIAYQNLRFNNPREFSEGNNVLIASRISSQLSHNDLLKESVHSMLELEPHESWKQAYITYLDSPLSQENQPQGFNEQNLQLTVTKPDSIYSNGKSKSKILIDAPLQHVGKYTLKFLGATHLDSLRKKQELEKRTEKTPITIQYSPLDELRYSLIANEPHDFQDLKQKIEEYNDTIGTDIQSNIDEKNSTGFTTQDNEQYNITESRIYKRVSDVESALLSTLANDRGKICQKEFIEEYFKLICYLCSILLFQKEIGGTPSRNAFSRSVNSNHFSSAPLASGVHTNKQKRSFRKYFCFSSNVISSPSNYGSQGQNYSKKHRGFKAWYTSVFRLKRLI